MSSRRAHSLPSRQGAVTRRTSAPVSRVCGQAARPGHSAFQTHAVSGAYPERLLKEFTVRPGLGMVLLLHSLIPYQEARPVDGCWKLTWSENESLPASVFRLSHC